LVQVHPNDAQTIERGLGRRGKEECWLIVAAEPGAKTGASLTDTGQLYAAISGESLLQGIAANPCWNESRAQKTPCRPAGQKRPLTVQTGQNWCGKWR
jgi:mannose-6-phosphate isomerase class I